MSNLVLTHPTTDVAVFNSEHVFPDLTLSHSVIYVRSGSSAACDVTLLSLLPEGAVIDSVHRTVSWNGSVWDIVPVSEIYPSFCEEAAREGGVIQGDVTLSRDTVLFNGLTVCGTLTVSEGVTLTLKRGDAVRAQSAVIAGHLLYQAPDFGFKPGHVVGPDARLDPQRMHVSGHTVFAPGARISGTGVSFYTGSADIQGDATFTGMITWDDLTVRRGVTLVTKDGCWLNWVHGRLEADITFRVSETEICVLEYIHHDQTGGYYDHTGFGTTEIAENVRLLGDETFNWFWMGDLDGRFAEVTGNIVMKAKQLVQVHEKDLENIQTTGITGEGTPESPYEMTWHVIDENHAYATSRTLAVDAAVNNVIQDRFPDCVLFDYWGKRVLGFRDLRAGNILIHKVDDVETLLYFADIVVYAKEI